MGATVDGASLDDAGFEEALAEVRRLPADAPDRGRRAAGLIEVLLRRTPGASVPLFRHLDELLAIADRDPPPLARWARTRCAARVMSLLYGMAAGTSRGTGQVATELAALADEAAGDPGLTAFVDSAHAALLLQQAVEDGNESALRRLPEAVAGLGSSLPGNPALAQLREMIQHGVEAVVAHRGGDTASAWRRFDQLQETIGKLPPDDPVRGLMAGPVAPAAAFRTLFDGDGSPRQHGPTEAELAAWATPGDQPGTDPQLSRLVAGAASLGLGQETDLARIDQGIAQFQAALEGTPAGHPQRAFCLLSVALARFRRSEVTGKPEELADAGGLLEEAGRLMGGPEHPLWTLVHDMLAAVRQRTGDYALVPETGITAQRGYAWRVLLEADPAGAQLAIEDAARDALDHARRSITVGDPADALRALDTGRGLMLFAATEAHRIPARLEAAGHADLARQWSQQRPPPDSLRRQVLEILTGQSSGSLFDPPALGRVQEALTLLEADALVYLVPLEAPRGGLAVMAPAVGSPAYMALPNLDLAAGTEIDQYLSALTTRDTVDRTRDLSPDDINGFADRVDALCDWAWRAAIGPLLESYLPRLAARPEGRVPRIVLIPMGDLARVPWHAARRGDGVYAVQLVGISQAVSARLLCENAALAPVPLGPTGLVVGDPDTGGRGESLRSARSEAYAVRCAYYRGARYIGRLADGRPSPSGPGTADEVRAWLSSSSPSAGAMLHLACHGFYASGAEAGARLLLAASGTEAEGERASELTVEELVDLLAGVPDRSIALVVLAACNTGRSVYGYDEAYSLGTGFLAGGARSVLSTQWSVPDAATSSLMYLFHHHLRHRGRPAWQALREAQVWMLDPDRVPPRGMPPELVPGPGDDPAGVLNWAGFTHYGQ